MFSLFAGFFLATFLIWLTGFLVREKKKSVHKDKKPKNNPNANCPQRQESPNWNVSTFFHLRSR